jgi:phenylacetate-CoA ligase
MAWECPAREGYHVDADSVLLEIVDDAGDPVKPGEVGRVLATGLISETMPLIRYEMGDLMVASDRRCSCGRGLPMVERLEGRWKDRFVLADGGTRAPRELLEPFGEIAQIEQYRLTVSSPSRGLLEYVASHGNDQAIADEARKRFAGVCPGVELHVTRVDDIAKTELGKRVMLVNHSNARSSPLASTLQA